MMGGLCVAAEPDRRPPSEDSGCAGHHGAGDVDSVRGEINEVIDREFAKIQAFCMELAKGKIAVC